MTTIARGKKEAVRLLASEAPAKEQGPQQLLFSVNYLSFFGYVATELLKNVTRQDVEAAVVTFQEWFGLVADGIVGPKTLRAMKAPRCGCPDIKDNANDLNRQFMQMQAVATENKSRWTKHGLTYAVEEFVSGIPKARQLKIFAAAFKSWTDVCGLDIRRIKDPAKADLLLGTGEGHRHQFDGRGGTLAWAYLPNGQDAQLRMRFDLAETWVSNPQQRGVLLANVAGHEFGHMLGLEHSKKSGALMAPFYNPHVAVPQKIDDVSRIVARYGKNKKAVTTSASVKAGAFRLQCSDLTIEGFDLVPK
jgi:matrix metalloproteinase-1 (interstitial collagenase)